MSVSPNYRTLVIEQLSRVAPAIRARSMFGGVGLYSRDLFFALIDDDVLYFKVDDLTRGDFVAQGLRPFMPTGDPSAVMQYYEVPAECLEDAEALRPWVEKGLAAAHRKKKSPAAKRRKTPRKRDR